MKHSNIHVIGLPEEEREQRIKILLEEILTPNFPNFVNAKESQGSSRLTQRGPNQDTIIQMAKIKDKERILKAAREIELVPYKGTPISLSADFSTDTFQVRREWLEIFKVMKCNDLQ